MPMNSRLLRHSLELATPTPSTWLTSVDIVNRETLKVSPYIQEARCCRLHCTLGRSGRRGGGRVHKKNSSPLAPYGRTLAAAHDQTLY